MAMCSSSSGKRGAGKPDAARGAPRVPGESDSAPLAADAAGKRQELRDRMRRRRDALPAPTIASHSNAIASHVLNLPAYDQARTLMAYWSVGSEVVTHHLIRAALSQGKRVCLPLALPAEKRLVPCLVRDPATDLRPGVYDIPEPDPERCPALSPAELDLVFVPGLAFDRRGHRLGYGQGWYDRFLASLPASAALVGLAFDAQAVDRLAVESWDVPVHLVVTEEGVVDCSHRAGK